MRKQWKKIVTLLMVFVMLITSIQPFSIKKVSAATKKVIYEETNCRITYQTSSEWEEGLEGQFIIENLGTAPLENWRFQLEYKYKITSIWDGEIESHKGNIYMIKYPSWNAKIPVSGKAIVGFNAKKDGTNSIPSRCKFLTARNEVSEDNYMITYRTISDWQDAFNGEISISNNTEKPIEGWQLEFDFTEEVSNFWTAKLLSHKDEHYIIKNDEWNSVIKPGETIKLGFEGKPGNVTTEPENYLLTEIQTNESKEETDDSSLTPEEEKKIADTEQAIKETEKNLSTMDINNPQKIADILKEQKEVMEVDISGEYLEITYHSGIKQAIILSTETDPLKQLRGGDDGSNEVALYSRETKSQNSSFFFDQNLLDMRKKYEIYDDDENCSELKNRKILLWAPMDEEWGSNDEVEVLKAIAATEDNLDLSLEIISDEKATADVLKNMSQYGMVILASHGHNGKWLMTGEKYKPNQVSINDKKALLNHEKQIITLRSENKTEQYFGITSKWLEQKITKKLPGTIVYNNSCGSFKSDDMWNVLEKKGASTYLGYTGNIRNEFAILNLTMFFTAFITERQSVFNSSSFLTDFYHNGSGSSFAAAGQGNYKISQDIKQSGIKKVEFPEQKEVKINSTEQPQTYDARIGIALPGIVKAALDALIAAIGVASASEIAILVAAFAVVAVAFDIVTTTDWQAVKEYIQAKSMEVWNQVETQVQVIQATYSYKATTKDERDYVLCQVESKKNERKTILCNTKYRYSAWKKSFNFDIKLRVNNITNRPPKVSLNMVLERADSKNGNYKVVKTVPIPAVDFTKTYTLTYPRKTGHYRLRCEISSSVDTIVVKKPYEYFCINRTGHVWKWNVTDKVSNKKIREPQTNYKKIKVSKKDRNFNYRELYISTYKNLYGKKYDKIYFSKNQIHHIHPLNYGGINIYTNLIHVTTIQHTPISAWFNGY